MPQQPDNQSKQNRKLFGFTLCHNLEYQARDERDAAERDILRRAEIRRARAAAKRCGTNRKQRKTDGRHYHGRHDGRNEPAPVLREQTQHALDQTAHHNGANRRIEAIGRRNAAQNRDERKADAHNNRQSRTNTARKGKQLNERANARNEHGALHKRARRRGIKAGSTRDNKNRREVGNEHGQDVLHAIRNCTQPGNLAVKTKKIVVIETLGCGFCFRHGSVLYSRSVFRQTKKARCRMRQRAPLFKIIYASQVSTVSSWLGAGSPAWRNVIWPVVGSIASTIASDSKW